MRDTPCGVGFPIRKSTDQRLFAPPRGLSQRTTSFIASQRQGIHRMPLRHLIALIINIHPLGSGAWPWLRNPRKVAAAQDHDIDGNDQIFFTKSRPPHHMGYMCPVGAGDEQDFFFTMSQEQAQGPPEAGALCKRVSLSTSRTRKCGASAITPSGTQMVEPDGIEPTTSCLQSRRSPN